MLNSAADKALSEANALSLAAEDALKLAKCAATMLGCTSSTLALKSKLCLALDTGSKAYDKANLLSTVLYSARLLLSTLIETATLAKAVVDKALRLYPTNESLLKLLLTALTLTSMTASYALSLLLSNCQASDLAGKVKSANDTVFLAVLQTKLLLAAKNLPELCLYATIASRLLCLASVLADQTSTLASKLLACALLASEKL